MKNFSLVILALAVVLSFSAIFVVQEGEKAIVLLFSKVEKDSDDKAVVYGPGLHLKVPFFSQVRRLDARIQTLDGAPDRFVTSEKKDLIVDSYVKWRINDFSAFYLRARGIDEKEARQMLMFAFAHEIIEKIRVDALKDRIDALVDTRLRGEISKCNTCAIACSN